MSRRTKFYLHVTAPAEGSIGIEVRPFAGLSLDQLPPMVGDRSEKGRLGLTRRYFTNPVLLIVHDDDFGDTLWPVLAVVNGHPVRGALVILAERTLDPHAPPLQGKMFLDGLTVNECQEAFSSIKLPPGFSLINHLSSAATETVLISMCLFFRHRNYITNRCDPGYTENQGKYRKRPGR